MTASRLQRIDDLVRELSIQEDPDRLVRVFTRHNDLTIPHDGIITVSRHDLEAPRYRITRSSRQRSVVNPWTEAHLLPVLDRGLLGELLYAGKPRVLNPLEMAPDDPAQEHFEGMATLACAPGYEQGRPLWLAVLLRRAPGHFSVAELETLLLDTNLLVRAASNLLLARQLREAYRNLDRELQLVGRMQRHLLPAQLPCIEGLELGASYVTCSRAGGDYYDVLPLPDGQWGLFLADVSGHGTPAMVVMAMLRTLLHSFPGPLRPPGPVLAYLNRHLVEGVPEGMFATAFYGVYDCHRRQLCYACAGHAPPRLRRGRYCVSAAPNTSGLPLGVLPQETWSEGEIGLQPGDALLLYTDGIVEGQNQAGEMFGPERLDAALRLGPSRAAGLVKHIERHYRDFCQGAPDRDDRTLLAAVAVP
jgi:sigma-B regulation protein RsbU (phosphoserine phosphatase)